MVWTDVGPYQDITFDKDGDVDPEQRDRLLGVEATDVVLFAHGWNTSPAVAERLYATFFAYFPELVGPGVRLGYAGVVWPSMRFGDEPLPQLPGAALPVAPSTGLDAASRQALAGLFPGHTGTVARLAALLDERPASASAVAEFGRLARRLAEAPAGGLETSCFTDDLPGDEQGPPAVLFEDPLAFSRRLAHALAKVDDGARTGPVPTFGFDPPDGWDGLWRGAKELLRQSTYYAMKRRAGTVGELGLGPLVAQLARSRPALRIHLVGHSQGARLVAFALRGLPDGVRTVKSVTLLQGAFSHYAFAHALPHAAGRSGALRSMEQRVDGPVVACHSHHDTALGTFYPLASGLARDDRSAHHLDGAPGAAPIPFPDPGPRWWAVGHDGFRAAPHAPRLTLADALASGLPRAGCVSVDVSSVVHRGGPPSGAHNDICHPELAQLVVEAGRLGD
ncbi:serine-threonine protein kinase [Streptomyces sp. NPDC047315]|uniref:serine-threonine protein kinase n=1 Tax=Streptomyces sp. NPDC047315 TaxID=3155142 RepID=UPI0033DFD612